MPYLSTSAVVIHYEEALYQVYVYASYADHGGCGSVAKWLRSPTCEQVAGSNPSHCAAKLGSAAVKLFTHMCL